MLQFPEVHLETFGPSITCHFFDPATSYGSMLSRLVAKRLESALKFHQCMFSGKWSSLWAGVAVLSSRSTIITESEERLYDDGPADRF